MTTPAGLKEIDLGAGRLLKASQVVRAGTICARLDEATKMSTEIVQALVASGQLEKARADAMPTPLTAEAATLIRELVGLEAQSS